MVGEPGLRDVVAAGQGLGEGEEAVDVLDFLVSGEEEGGREGGKEGLERERRRCTCWTSWYLGKRREGGREGGKEER